MGHFIVHKALAWKVVSPPPLEGFKFTKACWDRGGSGPPETNMDPDGCLPNVYQNYMHCLEILGVLGGLPRSTKSAAQGWGGGGQAAGLPSTPGKNPAWHVHR